MVYIDELQKSLNTLNRHGNNFFYLFTLSWDWPSRIVGRVSASGNGKSRVQSRAATYQRSLNMFLSCQSELGLVDPMSG